MGYNRLDLAYAYLVGKRECIREYAVWRDGQQYVGIMQKPLHEVLNALPDPEDVDMNALLEKM